MVDLEWSTNTDWTNAQSTTNIDINSGTFELADAIPDSGVSRWTFDSANTDASTAVDLWGSYDGTISGATTGVTGANQTYTTAEGYSFDGADDYVTFPDVGDIGNFSFAFWALADDTNAEYQPLAFSARGPLTLVRLNAGGTASDVRFFADPGDINLTHPGDITGWHHYVFTAEENGAFVAYIDGNQVGSQSIGTFGSATDNNAFGVGRGLSSRFLAGDMDDPRLYSKPLTSTEVSDLYNTGSI